MNASAPNQQALSAAVAQATRQAVEALFRGHADDFYDTVEAHAPSLSAWSWQALSRETQRQGLDSDAALTWSYADSPYAFVGEDFFDEVNRCFAQRPAMDQALSDAAWAVEFEVRLSAMEDALRQVDAQGLFGAGTERDKRAGTVEVLPPDRGNTERAMRLNPPVALAHWLAEAAEP